MSFGPYGVKSQNVAIFGQKSNFGDFSTSENNTWVRRSAEKFSAGVPNINYFLQKNFHGHTILRKFSMKIRGVIGSTFGRSDPNLIRIRRRI